MELAGHRPAAMGVLPFNGRAAMSTPKAQPERGQGIAVIVAQGRAPGLVRTVDTLIRQSTPPSAASIAAVESVARRFCNRWNSEPVRPL